MKKRILSMILMVTMIISVFTGCGAGGSANEITVSEMLNSIIEEKGEVVMYTVDKDGDDWTEDYVPSKNTKALVKYYNGETITGMYSDDKKLGNYLAGTSEINNKSGAIQNAESYLSLVTDDDGNVLYEAITFRVGTSKDYSDVRIGAFERVEIDGVSCMVFATCRYGNEKANNPGKLYAVEYVIIPDTEYTKDKTIVFDSIDTEGIKVKGYEKPSYSNSMFYTSDVNWKVED